MTLEFALPDWLAKLFSSTSTSSGEGTAWVYRMVWPWPAWAMLLAIIAVVMGVFLLYAREGAHLSRGARTLLVSLRLGALAILLFMLGEAVLLGQRTGLPYLVVVVDTSASMETLDRYKDARLRTTLEKQLSAARLNELTRINLAKSLLLDRDGELLRKIDANYKLRVYYLAESAASQSGNLAEVLAELPHVQARGEATRIGHGVRSILNDLRGTPPAAIVLLTDGINTEGEALSEAAEYARAKSVPLFFIGIGSDEPVRDVRLADLLVDDVVFVDDVVNFQGTLTGTGFAKQEVEVRLKEKDSGAVLARTKVRLAADGEPTPFRISHRPTQEGKFDFIVEAQPLQDETDTANNAREKSITVRKEQIRVLLVQAYPNFEFRYLKQMLERDKTIDLSTLLQEADLEYATLDPSALRTFPVQQEELFKYDVILFGDVNPGLLSASVLQSLSEFVEQKGGGIALIAGPRFTPLAYRETPLAALFPIDLNSARVPAGDEQAKLPFVMAPTDLGTASPHMQLGDTPEETARIWRQLAPLYWYLEAPHLKPAARVLAVHPSQQGPDGRPWPLVIMQYVGAGKVLFHATDETWRWRFRIGDVLFARYWVQAVRFLARSKLLGEDRGAELTADREEYLRGEAVHLRVRFLDERLSPAADDGVTVVVEGEGRPSRRVKLQRSSVSRAVFEGVFTGAGQGKYHAWMAAPTVAARAPAADFRILAPLGERGQTRTETALMATAAETTRGKFYQPQNARRLLADLPEGREIPFETLPPQPIWNRWWVVAIFLVLLTSEWVVRKLKGLI